MKIWCFAGGSAAQSELIHQRVRSLAQQTGTPVYTFAEDVAASGGWQIFSGPQMHACMTVMTISLSRQDVSVCCMFRLHRGLWCAVACTGTGSCVPVTRCIPLQPAWYGVDTFDCLHWEHAQQSILSCLKRVHA